MDKIEFGKFIQIERKRKGLSRRELAEMTGFTERTIQHWEEGTRNIALKNADVLTKALGISFQIGKKEKE